MTTVRSRPQVASLVGVAMAATASVGALLVEGDVEVTLLMVAAVVTGLVCFDTSMEKRLHAFGPWLLMSIAPVAKTVPTVLFQLRGDGSALAARYDHAGSLFFGVLLLGAVVMLALPARRFGRRIVLYDSVVIVGCCVVSAVAGSSVAFLFDLDFGTETAARLLETPTWFVLGGLLAATAQATGRHQVLRPALIGVLGASAISAAVLAYSVAGGSVDLGVWALLFTLLAASAALTNAGFAPRVERTRPTSAPVVASLVAGGVAGAAAISARSDPEAWGPGWIVLGIGSLAMFALAMGSKPRAEQIDATALDSSVMGSASPGAASTAAVAANIRGPQASDPLPIGTSTNEAERAARARARALQSLAQSALAPAELDVSAGHEPNEAAQSTATDHPAVDDLVGSVPRIAGDTTAAQQLRPRPQPQHRPSGSSSPQRGAAAIAPERAHHHDPSTGLLSAAGLQHELATAFAQRPAARQVGVMMIVVRNLDAIETSHGRLASAAVTRQVAERLGRLLPGHAAARFGRSAYAVVLKHDPSRLPDTAATLQRLAAVLLELRAPIEHGTFGDRIDIVAALAQCYEGEPVGAFVGRANQGLARAVRSSEPTFVAMP